MKLAEIKSKLTELNIPFKSTLKKAELELLLPKEEEKAFKESLWKIEPEYYGIGPNLKAWKRAWKKFFNRRK